MAAKNQHVINPHLMAMSPYSPPLEGRGAAGQTLLDFNERTIPVAEVIKHALHKFIDADHLQQYPAYGNIVKRLAEYTGLNEEQVMITNGSDQGIDLLFRAVAKQQAEAIIPAPCFAMYTQCAQVENMHIVAPEYTREKGYPLQESLAAINDNTAIIVIANPNNPSGTPIDTKSIKTLSHAAPDAAILVDECYYEFSGDTILPHIDELPNVFVTRTFSKTWGIPSLRFGYLMAHPDYIRALCNMRGPYDINQLAIVAANAALDAPEETQAYVKQVMQIAKPWFEQWLQQHSIDYWPGRANYLWTFPNNAEILNETFKNAGFLVRPKAWQEKLGLRISIGTLSQMQQLCTVWESVI